MPSRPDIREIASNVKEAFADMDRDTLLEILTFVLKEYVVEGPPPMLVHQAETLADLRGATFAQLISALQTRFDHAELQAFVVDGEQVGVRIGGVVQPLSGAAARQGGAAGMPAGVQVVDTRPPQPGVRVVETPLQQRPPQAAQPAPAQQQREPGSAPPPSRGLSVRGRPSGEGAPSPAPAQGQGQGAAPPAQGQQPAPQGAPQPGAPEKSDKPEGSGDDASARFSLLELD